MPTKSQYRFVLDGISQPTYRRQQKGAIIELKIGLLPQTDDESDARDQNDN